MPCLCPDSPPPASLDSTPLLLFPMAWAADRAAALLGKGNGSLWQRFPLLYTPAPFSEGDTADSSVVASWCFLPDPSLPDELLLSLSQHILLAFRICSCRDQKQAETQ